MGKLAKLVDGINEKLLAGRGGGGRKEAACSSGDYGMLDKTGSMKVENRSRRAQKLIAQNHRGGGDDKKMKKKRRLFGF